MKLIKIILLIFGIYLVRRFIQLYRAMKLLQEAQLKREAEAEAERGRNKPEQTNGVIVDAEYKVIR